MKYIGIISAMWLEIENIHSKMAEVEEIIYLGIKFYKGKINNKNVILTSCGIGKVNSAILTQIMIGKFDIYCIIHTGIAGSMDNNVKHTDVVVAHSLTYYDVRKEQMKNCFPYQEIFYTDERLTKLLLDSVEKNAKKGLIITGDDFICEDNKKEKLKEKYKEALCVDMESCSIVNTAFINNIPIGVIRCISDLANSSSNLDYKKFEKIAANKASDIVIKTISKI